MKKWAEVAFFTSTFFLISLISYRKTALKSWGSKVITPMQRLKMVLFFLLAAITVAIWIHPFGTNIGELGREIMVLSGGKAISLIGVFSLVFGGIGWLIFILLMFHFYNQGLRRKRPFNSLFKVAAVEMYCLPLLHLIRLGAYGLPDRFDALNTGISTGGLLLGIVFTVFAYRTSPRVVRLRRSKQVAEGQGS